MKKNLLLKKTVLISSLCFFSSQASALISVQALGGLYKATDDRDGTKTDYSGSEIALAAHLDPIPLVPIGFGLTFNLPNATGKPTGASGDFTMTAYNLGVSLKAWSPVGIFGVKPYLKLGYIVLGVTTFKGPFDVLGTKVDIETIYKNSGAQISAGLEYSLLPLISALFEVESQNTTLKVDELKGLPEGSTFGDSKMSALNFLFGLSVGL